VCSIVNGTRPTIPENAATIGLSDPLWELLQACWNGDRSQRPRMQDVEVQLGNAAARWETPTPSRRPVPFPHRPGNSLPNSLVVSPSSSSTETRNSRASDLPQSGTPVIRIDVVGLEENDPDRMQEFYPTPSPISPSQSGSQSNEALINRLDGVGPRVVWFDSALMPRLASRTRFSR